MDIVNNEPTAYGSRVVFIDDTLVAAPYGAISYKYADAVSDDGWLYMDSEVAAIRAEDPSLIRPIMAIHIAERYAALLEEAMAAGDREMAKICRSALAGDTASQEICDEVHQEALRNASAE